jgi:hypothetical protein
LEVFKKCVAKKDLRRVEMDKFCWEELLREKFGKE